MSAPLFRFVLLGLLSSGCTAYWEKTPTSQMLSDILADDGDGVEGDADKCPYAREDMDGFEDDDGCPDYDNDGDGFVDVRDACPNDPGGEAWVVDSPDGCVPDADGDGIVDNLDRCPQRPEVFNGFRDEDGCPDKKIVVTEDRVEFEGTVLFKTDSAEIDESSSELLQTLAEVLMEHPELKRIEVGGHTDDVGSNRYNKRLSQARAESVLAAIVGNGVDEARLSARGYGESKPVIKDTTEEARAANRRVELLVKERGPAKKRIEVEGE